MEDEEDEGDVGKWYVEGVEVEVKIKLGKCSELQGGAYFGCRSRR